jgi:hypothetical protein
MWQGLIQHCELKTVISKDRVVSCQTKLQLGVYGDVYLYHDTHLHPAKFFLPLYVSPDTYNEQISKQYSYFLIIILIIQAIANI